MKKLYFLALFVCINSVVFGNVNTYTFARSVTTYTPLVGGTPLVPPNSGISGAGWFEQYYNVALPFVFFFNGKGYSNVIVNSNGFLAFGTVNNGGTYPFPCNAFPQIITSGQSGTIMGYCTNTYSNYLPLAGGSPGQILGGLIDFPNANPIVYSIIGTAPNRTFIVQWTNAERSLTYFASSGTASESITFQIALQETTNAVKLTYNTSTDGYTNSYSVFPGIVGAATSDYNIVNGTSWSTGVASTSSQTGILFSSSVSIPAGTTYTFTPPSGLQPTACSGTPTAPTAVANVGIAAGGPATIGLNNIPLSTGLTYQWQSSSTGLANSWTNLSGATTAVLTITPTAAAYYQCLLACGAGPQVASSSVALGYESAYPAIPSYTYNTSGGYPSSTIGFFSISGGACGTTLSDANNALPTYGYTTWGGTGGTQYNYTDYTGNPTHLKLQGSTTTTTSFTANINNNGSNSAAYAVWMDINDNGNFGDAGELLGGVNGVVHTSTNFTITIPANSFGMHRLRIRGSYGLAYPYTSIPPTGAMLYFGETNDYFVEVLPPTPVASNNSPVCPGGTLGLTAASISGSPIYTWTGPLSYYGTTTATTKSYTVPSIAAAGIYTLTTTVDGSNACTAGTTTVTVNPNPTLTSASNSGPICAGNTLTLNANGAANVTGYSWTGPVAITSPTSATATVPGATAAATGTYSVAVNNGVGSGCVVTYTTSATVNALPNVSVFSTNAANACATFGSVVTVGSSSLGAGTYTITYNLSGANSAIGNTATLVLAGGTGTFTTSVLGTAGATTVTITSIQNSSGCSSTVLSGNSFGFTVNPLPSLISGTKVVCAGLTTTLSDAGGGSWISNNTAIATIGSASGIATGISGGVATITYSLPTTCYITTPLTVNQTPAITGVTGACVGNTTALGDPTPGGTWTSSAPSVATVGSSSGIVTGISLGASTISYTLPSTGCTATVTVNITAPPIQFTVTGGGMMCAGSAGLLVGLTGSSLGVGYQLYNSGTAVGLPVSGTGGALSFGLQTLGGIYTVVANPGTTCATNMIGGATIIVNALPTVYNVTGGGAYCFGTAGVHTGLSGSNVGINYQLYNGSSTVGSPVAGTGTALDFGVLTAVGTYTVSATNATTGCTSNMSGSAVIGINPAPSTYSVTGGGAYCAGGTGFAIGVSNSEAGVSYQLYLSGIPAGAPIAGTGSPISFGVKTIGGVYTVIGTRTATGCTTNMTGTASITVNALPTIFGVTGGGRYCAGGTGLHIGLNGSTSGVTYTVYLGGVSTGVTGSGTGVAIDFGAFTGVGIYTVVAANATTGCINNMLGSVTITTNPLPTVFSVTGGGSYCAGGTGVHVGLSGSVLGTTYFLYDGGTLIGAGSGTSAPLDFGLKTAGGIYTVVATIPGTGCSANMTGSVTITINPLPTAYPLTGGGAFCAGGTGLNVGLGNSDAGNTYRLLNGGVPVGSVMPGTSTSINFGLFTAPGVYTVLATTTATGCTNTMTGSVSVSINPLPTPHNVTGGGGYCAGGTGVHVGLNGSEISNSYQLMNISGPVGTPITGTGATLDFGLLTAAGTYTIVASNTTTGCVNNMSGSATITINSLPTAYTVSGGGNYCFGGYGFAVLLSNSAIGTNYQLYLGSVSVGLPVAGTGSPLSFGLQTTAGTYTVIAANPGTGCTNVMTGSAIISIAPLPTAFTVTGGGNYCAGGTGVDVGLSNSTTGVNYQLYNGATAVGSVVAGSTLPIDFGLQTVAGSYTVRATNASTGCTATMTGSANITIGTLPATFVVTGGGSYCAGGTGVHVGLASSVTGISYQLYNGVSGMGGAVGGTGAALDFGSQTIAGTYTVKGTNTTSGCTGTMTGSVIVSVNTLPVLHNVTGGGNYCVGGTGVVIGLDGTNTGISYQLYNGTTAVGSPISGSGPAISFGLQTATGVYSVQATNTTTGCVSNMTGTATVTISATPTVYAVTGGGNYCPSGTGVAVGLGGSDPGVSYQLYNGTAIGSPVSGTGAAISFGLQTVTGTYTVVASGSPTTCVANMSGSATVVISTAPGAHSVTGGGDYCFGGLGVPVGMDKGEVGINYQLYNVTAVGAPVAGTGVAFSFGNQITSGVYTVIATDGTTGCTATMANSVGVVVDPLPTTYAVTGGGGYCAGGPGADVQLAGSDIGTNYQLFNTGVAVGTGVPGSGASLDFGPQPAGVYTLTATNATTHCVSNMIGSVTVGLNPLPAPYIMTGGGAYCAGGTGVDVQLNGSAVGIHYQLYDGLTAIGTPVSGTGTSLDFGLKTSAGTYTVQATNTTTGCTNTMTGAATVVANPVPVVYTVTGSAPAYCAGGAGVTISMTGSDAGVNYQLYHNGTALGSSLPGSGAALSFGAQTLVGAYTVVATNATSACTAHMAGGAAVAINATPVAYNVTGGGAYCSGGSGVHVSLSGTTSGILYQLYQSTTAVGIPATGSGGVLDFGLQTTAGNYTVVATNPASGCTANMTGSASVGVNPVPTAYAVLGGGSYCAGGAGVNIALISSVTGINYQLQNGSTPMGIPLSGTGAALDFGHQTVAGIYHVVATNTITGCSSNMLGSGTVAVNPVPAAYPVTGGGSYCAGSTGVHVGLNNSAAGISYQLYKTGSPVGGTTAGIGASIDFGLQTATGTYTVIATDTLTGCVNNMPGSAAVTINPLPTVYAVTGGGNYCAGGAGVHVGLTNSALGINYTLFSGSAIGTLHGSGGALDFGLQTATGSYTIAAANVATGCVNNMSGSAAVGINPVVVPSVAISSPGGNLGCTGHMSTFIAMPSNGGSTPAYQWTVNGVAMGTGANTMSYVPVDGDVVTVTMTSNAACAIPSSAANNTTMSVSTLEHPIVLVSSDHGTQVCQGAAVTFTAVPSYGGSSPIYTWVKNGVADTADILNTYSYAPSNGDNVYCVLRSSYYCRLADTGKSNVINMTAIAPLTPVVVITASNGGSVAAGVQEVLTATITNGGPSPTYQWSVNGIEVPGATLPVFTSKVFSDQDDITCAVTSDGPCGGLKGTGSITIRVWNVGVQQVTSSAGTINIVPNPNKGTFSIVGSLGSVNDEKLTIELTDLLGRVVYSDKAIAKNGKLNERIQLSSSLSNGMYLLSMHTETENYVFHVVVEQ